MEIFGIGPLELIAILIILLVVFGPGDMVKMGATLGRSLRHLRQSDAWHAMLRASRELRSLPDSLARQAGIDDFDDLRSDVNRNLSEGRRAIKDLDRKFVAWTRTGEQEDESPPPAPEDE
ncbi:MAG: hypothetical protein DWG76_03735 [Chloroflexi bacterium]|nr:hypothetical protein [Chloroflexota bacterium]